MVGLFRSLLVATGIAASLPALSGVAWASCGPEPFIGSICMTGGEHCPRGYLEADGRALEIAQNHTLFAALGNRYGGDGRRFLLPDLRKAMTAATPNVPNPPRNPPIRFCVATEGVFPSR